MKILMITPHFPPQLNAESICNGKLAQALVKEGAQLTVLTQDHNFSPFLQDESSCWRELGVKTVCLRPPWYDRGPRPLASLAARFRSLNPVATRFSAMALKPGRRILDAGRFDAIFSPYDGNPTAYNLRREFKLKWAMGINDPFPTCLYPPPYGPGGPVTRRERRQVEWARKAVAKADLVVFPSRRLAGHLEKGLNIDLGGKSLILPHIGWKRNANRAEGKGADHIEVLHAGSLDGPRVTHDFFIWWSEELARFSKLRDRVRLTVLGKCDDDMIAFVAQRGLERLVFFEPAVSYEESLSRLAQADALLLIEAKLTEGIFLPSKFCDYVATGKPLLLYCPEHGTIADQVGNDHPGFLGQNEDQARSRLRAFFQCLSSETTRDQYRCLPAERFEGQALARVLLEELEHR